MVDLQGMLEAQATWMYKRCRTEALKLPGVDAHDLAHDAWMRFVKRAEEGFFDQRPSVSLEAQTRFLLRKCILWVATDHRRRWRRQASPGAPTEEDEGDAMGRLPDDRPVDPDEAMQHGQELRQLLALVAEATSPVRGLCLLSRDVPRGVLPDHVERARAYRRGGSTMPERPSAEAWALVAERREIPELVCDPERWKPELGEIYYASGPFGSAPATDKERLGGNVERQANRAVRDLQQAVAQARVRS